jgi:hypothetical protein
VHVLLHVLDVVHLRATRLPRLEAQRVSEALTAVDELEQHFLLLV